ncbi:MAG: hypothetical protein AB7H96_23460 [Vicinamibacterales bacterium]
MEGPPLKDGALRQWAVIITIRAGSLEPSEESRAAQPASLHRAGHHGTVRLPGADEARIDASRTASRDAPADEERREDEEDTHSDASRATVAHAGAARNCRIPGNRAQQIN